MKLPLLLFATLVTIFCTAQSPDEVSVKKILNDQSAAWNRGDIEGFMHGYWENDSLMFIGKSGVTYGWHKTLDNYKRNYPDTVSMGKLAFTIISTKSLSPEYFHVIGKWHLHRSIGDLEGHFTLLFRKINGQWVIIDDHSS
jgi:ketosteroid isomerase-like protein